MRRSSFKTNIDVENIKLGRCSMTNYDRDWVRSFFDEYGMREWERWDLGPVEQVKFAVHLHYLKKYLSASDRILEIGVGPGRFTQELVRIVNKIVVADISPVQLQLNRERAQKLGYSGSIERWVECDMCELGPHFDDATFDAIVCYGGPLSYVLDEREKAISELLRVTKPGGLLFLGVMSLWGSIHHYLPGVLELDPRMNRNIIATGDLTKNTPEASTHYNHMYRSAEFRDFLEGAGAEIVAMSASDCLSANWVETLEEARKDPVTWEHLLEMELEACREPGCLDMGTHLIAVCRKPG
jgi:ubiquinone/menaquinone biosynthesis C-methylase UbiE